MRRGTRARLVRALGAALAVALVLALPAAAAAPAPVFFMLFDELPVTSLQRADGSIDPVRFPNFAALAAGSTWYRNATSTWDKTAFAVPSILTGLNARFGPPTFQTYPQSLFTAARDAGYALQPFEAATTLCPPGTCLPHDLSVLRVLGSGRRPDLFGSVLGALGPPGDRPTFTFEHAFLPHPPWQYMPDGRVYRRNLTELRGVSGAAAYDEPFLVAQAQQRHLLQLGYTDRLLGELVARLRALGLYDRALVVVLADHGVSFRVGEHRRIVTRRNIQDEAAIPLFIKRPGQVAGEVTDRHVSTLDIAPTLADILHIRLGYPPDGVSALRPETRDRATWVRMGGRRGPVRMRVSTYLRRRRASLARRLAVFGSGTWDRVFRIGPDIHALAGRPPTPLLARRAWVGARAALYRASTLATVDVGTGFEPLAVTGKIMGARRPVRRDIAVAVDGVIRATGRTFHLSHRRLEEFSVMLPETALRPGGNVVEIYEIRHGRRGIALVRLGGTRQG
jgi:hypothetical protein